jgi:nitrogen fixation/metabolism regulation signal transduction histidine kinase
MRGSHFVASAEGGAIGFAQSRLDVRIAILFAVVHVRPALISIIALRALDAIVKTASLNLV